MGGFKSLNCVGIDDIESSSMHTNHGNVSMIPHRIWIESEITLDKEIFKSDNCNLSYIAFDLIIDSHTL